MHAWIQGLSGLTACHAAIGCSMQTDVHRVCHHMLHILQATCCCRAVNALLTQLDALKIHSNVMILTTSNITEAIDLAFVDRADIKAYIGPPSWQVSMTGLAAHVVQVPHLVNASPLASLIFCM